MAFGSNGSSQFPKNVYFNEVTIDSIDNAELNNYNLDIALEFKYSYETPNGKTINKRAWISGNHGKDKNGELDFGNKSTGVDSYGSWVVSAFLNACGLNPRLCLTEDGSSLLPQAIDQIVGKKINLAEYECKDSDYREIWKGNYEMSGQEGKMKLVKKWNDKEPEYLPKKWVNYNGNGSTERLADEFSKIQKETNKEPWEL